MIVALTGTPGTGKTSVSRSLRRDYMILDVNQVVRERRLHLGRDKRRGPLIADIEKLKKYVARTAKSENLLVVSGHISHLLDSDMVIVLRTDPRVLRKRLQKKKFHQEKIEENIMAETIDVILIESVGRCEKVYEIDTTGRRPSQIAVAIREILKGENLLKYSVGQIDWTEQI